MKKNVLRVPYGTAIYHLRRNLLFDFVKQLNRDICFRCGEKITKIEDFSIDHKEPWKFISAKLFWDLNNIAFSHLKCNVDCRRKNGKRKVGPRGFAWCCGHQKFLSFNKFHKDKTHWNGVRKYCIQCVLKRF